MLDNVCARLEFVEYTSSRSSYHNSQLGMGLGVQSGILDILFE